MRRLAVAGVASRLQVVEAIAFPGEAEMLPRLEGPRVKVYSSVNEAWAARTP